MKTNSLQNSRHNDLKNLKPFFNTKNNIMKYIQPSMSDREMQVLEKLSQGLTAHEVGLELFISHHTVISHRRSLLQKLDAINTAHLIRMAYERKILLTEQNRVIVTMNSSAQWPAKRAS